MAFPRCACRRLCQALLVLVCACVHGQEGQVTYPAIEDTFVQKRAPDKSNAKAKTVVVDGGDKKVGDIGHTIAFLKFRLDAGGRPIWTKLRMKVSTGGHSQSNDAGRIHLVEGNWDEKTVTYANRPEPGREVGRMGKVEQGETIERDLDVNLDGLKEISLALVPTTGDGAVLLSREGGCAAELAAFYGNYAVLDSGPLKLTFTEGTPKLTVIKWKDEVVGSLGCGIAQFERKGIGYKGAGVGVAEANVVKDVKVTVNEPTRCVVRVTAARTESAEMARRFEATYQFTAYAGQNWFESKLLSVTNRDDVAYEVRGYSLRLLPPAAARPWCYPIEPVSAWIGGNWALGALAGKKDDVTLSLRLVGETPNGDMTGRLNKRLSPGETWSGEEPAVVVFAAEADSPKAMVRESRRIRDIITAPDQHATGTILLTEYEHKPQKE